MHKIKISTGRPFTAEQIWNKLESLYQLDMLDETEILNFQLCEKTHFRNLSKNGLFRKFPVFQFWANQFMGSMGIIIHNTPGNCIFDGTEAFHKDLDRVKIITKKFLSKKSNIKI